MCRRGSTLALGSAQVDTLDAGVKTHIPQSRASLSLRLIIVDPSGDEVGKEVESIHVTRTGVGRLAMTKYVRIIWSNAEPLSHLGFPVHLTQRQREVLLLLCEGLPNKRVGRALGVSASTVKSHVASVLRSLNVATRLEAVAVAFRLGLVQPCEARPEYSVPDRGFAMARSERSANVSIAA